MSKPERRDLEECMWCNNPIIDCRCHYNDCNYLKTFDDEDCNCEEIGNEIEEIEKKKMEWNRE